MSCIFGWVVGSKVLRGIDIVDSGVNGVFEEFGDLVFGESDEYK